MKSRIPLARLACGLLIGAALGGLLGRVGARLVSRSAPADSSSFASAPLPDAATAPWSWRDSPAPSALSAETSRQAIEAWLAFRPSSPAAPDRGERLASLRALLARLPSGSFPQLLDALAAGAARSPQERRLRDLVFNSWTLLDPASATRWIVARSPGDRQLFLPALQTWAALDPLAASRWACALPDETDARWLGGEALAALAGGSPDQAIALARSRGPAFRDAVLHQLLGALGRADPAGTLAAFAPDLWKHGRGFQTLQPVIDTWAQRDPAAALAWLIAQPRPNDILIGAWLAQLGGSEPVRRRAFAEAVARSAQVPHPATTLGGILAPWIKQSPGEVLDWLQQLPNPDLRSALLEHLAHSAYQLSAPERLTFVLALPEGTGRERALATQLGDWATTDAPAALAWINQHAAAAGVDAATSTVQATILGEIALAEPATALAEWEKLSSPAAKDAAIDKIMWAWGQSDPAAALRWAAEQNRARHSLAVNPVLIYAWVRKDPEAALRWAESETLLLGPVARRMSPSLISALGGYQENRAPRAATADLCSKIADPGLRAEALGAHLRDWLAKDRPAARAWIENHDALSPEQAAALLASPLPAGN